MTGKDNPAVMAMQELKFPNRQHAKAVSIKNSMRDTLSDNFEFDKISDATFVRYQFIFFDIFMSRSKVKTKYDDISNPIE